MRDIIFAIMADIGRKQPLDGELPPRKKLKLNDLPISPSKRSSIESLLHTFRKKGEYDAMRKQIFAQFESSVSIIPVTSGD